MPPESTEIVKEDNAIITKESLMKKITSNVSTLARAIVDSHPAILFSGALLVATNIPSCTPESDTMAIPIIVPEVIDNRTLVERMAGPSEIPRPPLPQPE